MNRQSLYTSSFLLFLFGIFFFYLSGVKKIAPPTSPSPVVLGEQTKTSECVINGPFPDKACTPGSVFPHVTKEDICKSGYSATVRNVSVATKKQVYAEYGLSYPQTKGAYECDHFISLELGGNNDISNLFPEAANPTPGFHQKDLVENYLHDEVCHGRLPLQQAQLLISTNWLMIYNTIK